MSDDCKTCFFYQLNTWSLIEQKYKFLCSGFLDSDGLWVDEYSQVRYNSGFVCDDGFSQASADMVCKVVNGIFMIDLFFVHFFSTDR